VCCSVSTYFTVAVCCSVMQCVVMQCAGMCTYIYVYIYIYIYVYMYTYINVYTYICIYVYIHKCIHMYIYAWSTCVLRSFWFRFCGLQFRFRAQNSGFQV